MKNKIFIVVIASSIAFIASSSLLAADAGEFDAAAAYQASCNSCHGTGAAHAPIVGEVIEWEIRAEKGMDVLVESAIKGLNGSMPPRGLCADCSDAQLKAIVEYMLENSK